MPPAFTPAKLVLHLATPEGCRAELIQVADYARWWYVCLKIVTHPSTNKAKCNFVDMPTDATAVPCWQLYTVDEGCSSPFQWQQQQQQPFNGLFSRTTWVSRYQKGKTNLDFTGARDSEWQWHQLGHMQVCTLLQTDNHASTPPLCFLQAGCPSCRPTNSDKALKVPFQWQLYIYLVCKSIALSTYQLWLRVTNCPTGVNRIEYCFATWSQKKYGCTNKWVSTWLIVKNSLAIKNFYSLKIRINVISLSTDYKLDTLSTKIFNMHTHAHAHVHTHPFNLDFTEARESEWQWHQQGHMQVCTSLQRDNHATTPPLSFYRPDALPAAQPTASMHWRQ